MKSDDNYFYNYIDRKQLPSSTRTICHLTYREMENVLECPCEVGLHVK